MLLWGDEFESMIVYLAKVLHTEGLLLTSWTIYQLHDFNSNPLEYKDKTFRQMSGIKGLIVFSIYSIFISFPTLLRYYLYFENIQNEDMWNVENYRVLTDINGMEDFLGDMDFKFSNTR